MPLFEPCLPSRYYHTLNPLSHIHTLEELQVNFDVWLKEYNEERTHHGRWCYGKTPMQTFLDSIPLAKEKMIAV